MEKKYSMEGKQTHDVASRFGNRTALFILATWTLGDCVAPDQEVLVVMNDISLSIIMMTSMMTAFQHIHTRLLMMIL